MKELFDLIFARDHDALKKAFANGASPDAQDKYGRSLLSLASACAYLDVMETLVACGADVNKPNGDDLGYTPLIEAAREGRDNVKPIEWLLKNGANIEGGDTRNGTAVLHACISAHPNILKCLLKNGAMVDAVDSDGQTALHYLCRYAKGWGSGVITETVDGVTRELENPRFKEHTEIFEILLEAGADVNKLANYGYVPLHLAAETDTASFIAPLVAKGANVNFANSKLFTPMHGACDRGCLDAVKELIKAGAHVNVVDGDGFTPLLGAVMSGNAALVKLLLEHGATKEAKAKISYGQVAEGDTPIDVAKKMGNASVVELLS